MRFEMHRKSVIAALLLPLPFAALPLIAFAVGHFSPSPAHPQLTITSVSIQQPANIENGQAGHRLAYGVADSQDPCADTSTPRVES
jgi:hypothetical protein